MVPFMRKSGKILYSQAGNGRQDYKAHAGACWVLKVTNTHSEYTILIDFQPQQLLHGCAVTLHYTYIACLVFHSKKNLAECD